MAGIQAIFLAICFPVLAIGLHELTHLTVARIACPLSIEQTSWVPFRLRLDFERLPAKATLRMIALALYFSAAWLLPSLFKPVFGNRLKSLIRTISIIL